MYKINAKKHEIIDEPQVLDRKNQKSNCSNSFVKAVPPSLQSFCFAVISTARRNLQDSSTKPMDYDWQKTKSISANSGLNNIRQQFFGRLATSHNCMILLFQPRLPRKAFLMSSDSYRIRACRRPIKKLVAKGGTDIAME